MIELKGDFDATELAREIKKLSKDSGITVQFVCHEQMRLYGQRMIIVTQPRVGRKGTLVEGQQARTVGERRVELDINKILVGTDDSLQEWQPLEINGLTFQRVRDRTTGASWGVQLHLWERSASESTIRGVHEASRNKRGRVKPSGPRQTKIGGFPFINTLHVPVAAKKEYIRARQAAVGTLKAGWVDGVMFYAKLVRAKPRIPKWIKAKAVGKGTHGGKVNVAGRGEISITNIVSYAGAKIPQQVVDAERRRRQRDILKQLPKRMDKLVKRFNSKK